MILEAADRPDINKSPGVKFGKISLKYLEIYGGTFPLVKIVLALDAHSLDVLSMLNHLLLRDDCDCRFQGAPNEGRRCSRRSTQICHTRCLIEVIDSVSSKHTRICAAPNLHRVKGRSSPARGYKFGCVSSYMAS